MFAAGSWWACPGRCYSQVMIRLLLFALILLAAPLAVSAQIYRCETEEGVVFSDRECGPATEIVEIEDETSGISIEPPTGPPVTPPGRPGGGNVMRPPR